MIGGYRARERGRLWAWLNRRASAYVCRSSHNISWGRLASLAVSSAIFVNDPTGLCAESFQDFIIITMFRELIVSLSSKTGIYLSSDGSSPSFSPLVVLPLLPRRHPPGRTTSSHFAPDEFLFPRLSELCLNSWLFFEGEKGDVSRSLFLSRVSVCHEDHAFLC